MSLNFLTNAAASAVIATSPQPDTAKADTAAVPETVQEQTVQLDSALQNYVRGDTTLNLIWNFPGQLPADDFYKRLHFQKDGSALFFVGKDDKNQHNSLGTIEDIASNMVNLQMPNVAPFIKEGEDLYHTFVRNLADVIAYDNEDVLTNPETCEVNPHKLQPGDSLYIRPEVAEAFRANIDHATKGNLVDRVYLDLYWKMFEEVERIAAENDRLRLQAPETRVVTQERPKPFAIGPSVETGSFEYEGANTQYGAFGLEFVPNGQGLIFGVDALSSLVKGELPTQYSAMDTAIGPFAAHAEKTTGGDVKLFGLRGLLGYDFGPLSVAGTAGWLRAQQDRFAHIKEYVDIDGVVRGNTDSYTTQHADDHLLLGGQLGFSPIPKQDNFKLNVSAGKAIGANDSYHVGGGAVYRFR